MASTGTAFGLLPAGEQSRQQVMEYQACSAAKQQDLARAGFVRPTPGSGWGGNAGARDTLQSIIIMKKYRDRGHGA